MNEEIKLKKGGKNLPSVKENEKKKRTEGNEQKQKGENKEESENMKRKKFVEGHLRTQKNVRRERKM